MTNAAVSDTPAVAAGEFIGVDVAKAKFDWNTHGSAAVSYTHLTLPTN